MNDRPLPTSSTSDQVNNLIKYFDDRNMPNCAILCEVLERQSDLVAIATLQRMFTENALSNFKSEQEFWLAQGVFSSCFVLGLPDGSQTPLQTIEYMISEIGDGRQEIWDNFEQNISVRMYEQIGKGYCTDSSITVIVISSK